MGNSQSNEEHAPSPGSRKGTPQPGSRHRDHSRDARKTPSSSSHHVTKAAVLPFSTPGASTSTTTNAIATATVSRSPVSSRSRARSINSSSSIQNQKGLADDAGSHKSNTSSMGNSESKQRPPSRSATLPPKPTQLDDPPSPMSQPVAVPPQGHDGLNEQEIFERRGSDTMESPFSLPASHYSRPPRLPLPIEEEVHTPGSPIITSMDLGSSLDHNGIEGAIPRRTSVLSSTTVDDEDMGGDDAFAVEDNSPTVPTTIEWNGDGDKIYVTGTFVNWERKFKLHKVEGKQGYSAALHLKPGTHHIKFLVDGDMVTSEELPTTVDYTNILVNYIEVVAPLPPSETQPPVPAEPMQIPGAAATAGQVKSTDTSQSAAVDIPSTGRQSDQPRNLSSSLEDAKAAESSQQAPGQQSQAPPTPQPEQAQEAKPLPKQKIPRAKYTNQLPEYLYDLDVYINPEDEHHQRVNRVLGHLPQPPSLPMFMSKSILNGTTPHKDDASVLIMPNHTVLNHLATSSIKHGVLATSGTTRYKRKFLTTIMYKPTSDDG